MTDAPLYGLILAGGRSSRMGTSKALMHYHGKPQYVYLYELLQRYCRKVYVSCKQADESYEGYNPLPDYYEGDNPMNGLLTAIQKHPDVCWLTVPVDMPLVDDKLIRYLISHKDSQSMASCFYDSSGNSPEPLLALWKRHAYRPLEDFYHLGHVSLRDFISRHPVNIIPVPDKNYLLNINTPEELKNFIGLSSKIV
ncbi:MAG: molybdenum cofactor guanylyltransferase [Cyclobacteriaceae bacterium]|jgi:molybdopterin-guanine dinucleotide biosynthesis protein A|nr:molybdenum cofactor guanylyltransferase [Cyclobacteriaceae bacterium]